MQNPKTKDRASQSYRNFKKNISKVDDVRLFLLLLFIMVFVLTLVAAYFKHIGKYFQINPVQTLTPAMAAMITIKLKDKTCIPNCFNYYIGCSGITIILISLGIISSVSPWLCMGISGSIFLISMLLEDKKNAEIWGLRGGNIKKTIKWLFAYIILISFVITSTFFVFYFLCSYTEQFKTVFYNGDYINSRVIFADTIVEIFTLYKTRLIYIPIQVFNPISIYMIFGEEYGWRFFLQPRLQKKFGEIGGVVLLGIIWAVWHFNNEYFMELPESVKAFGYTSREYLPIVYSARIVTEIFFSIWFAYFYKKSGSIWCMVLIHAMHNLMNIWNIFTIAFRYKGLVVQTIILLIISLLILKMSAFSGNKSDGVVKI